MLSQDGFVSEGTLHVEDGSGVKSGLLLGVGLAECVDPTTEQGVINVRYADRTYASIRDLKIFTTAIASAQYSLADAAGKSITNLEQALQLVEDSVSALDENVREALTISQSNIDTILVEQNRVGTTLVENVNEINSLEQRVSSLEEIRLGTASVATLDTTTNEFYYAGTIQVVSGVVTGASSSFSSEFEVGSVFIATTEEGEDVEFTVAAFDTISPGSVMTVTPTNKNIAPASKYRKSEAREIKLKVNELISALKQLRILP